LPGGNWSRPLNAAKTGHREELNIGLDGEEEVLRPRTRDAGSGRHPLTDLVPERLQSSREPDWERHAHGAQSRNSRGSVGKALGCGLLAVVEHGSV
jgi:hypothetical protein